MGNVLLLGILVVGIASKNSVMISASAVLLVAQVFGLEGAVVALGRYGVPAGVVLLIMVVLLPLLEGRTQLREIGEFLTRPDGLLTVGVGVLSTYLGGEGVALMQSNPEVVVGIVVGTTLGTVFFRGIPTGPLVAAGAVALILRLLL